MKTVSIVGYGRFGKTLHRLLKDDFKITIGTRDNIPEIYQSETIFYCVPISSFNEVIKTHKKYFKDYHVLIDVLSVKEYPATVFKKHLKNLKTQAILTHPVFGPDSSKNGFTGLPMVMDRFLSNEQNFNFWKEYFAKKGISVMELSPEEHDRLAADSQGVTHFMGRLLEEFKFKPTIIDTLGAKKLHEVMDQTCNDTWELFLNLQNYNHYTKRMRIQLGKAYDKLYNKLLPKRVDPKHIIYGIQGGIGSFNEEAINAYTNKRKIKNFRIKYLFTTENVLKNLYEGNIDYGQFAIQNAVGGVVQESTHAMSKYKFKIVDEFAILIRHCLMKRKDIDVQSIDRIMAHPQNFAQCKTTMANKYPNLLKESGKGEFIDTAKTARALSKGKIAKNTAILGPSILAKLYNFDIIAENLQDSKEN